MNHDIRVYACEDDYQLSTYLDIETWPRRHHFGFFKGYDDPFFSVCAPVDITGLKTFIREETRFSVFIAYHYLSLKAANRIEPFRYRIRGERVLVHDRVDAGTTVMVDDERFAFCYFDYHDSFEQFHLHAADSIERARATEGIQGTREDRDDLIHHTVLPWISFTSVTHPRRWSRPDSIPKVAFGRIFEEGQSLMIPVSVEVHHALMDGLHVGRYLQELEDSFADPRSSLFGP